MKNDLTKLREKAQKLYGIGATENNDLTELRDQMQKLYDVDIINAKIFYKEKSCTFNFPKESISIILYSGTLQTREEELSEALWMDDLSLFKESMAVPSLSKNGNQFENFSIDGVDFRSLIYKSIRGSIKVAADWSPMYFLSVGETLGRIHAIGMDSYNKGFRYKRKHWTDKLIPMFDEWIEKKREAKPEDPKYIKPESLNRAVDVISQVKAITEDPSYFGMIHGEFHPSSFFVEGNNIFPFDFSDCCYGYFIKDISTTIASWLLSDYPHLKNKSAKETLYEDILPYFRYGYELNTKLPEEQWDLLELFLTCCICTSIYTTDFLSENSSVEVKNGILNMFIKIFEYDDIFEGFDVALGKVKNI